MKIYINPLRRARKTKGNKSVTIFNLFHLRSVTFLLTSLCFVQTILQAQSVNVYKIAHRGGFVNSDVPENTIASLNQAIQKNYSHVEVDVRMTMDDVLICFHDENLKRMTGFDKKVSEMKRVEIHEMCLIDSDQKIPTLREFLAHCKNQIRVMVDIKGCAYDQIGKYSDKLFRLLEQNNLDKDCLILINKSPTDIQLEIANQFKGKCKISWRGSYNELSNLIATSPDSRLYFYVFNHAEDFSSKNVALFKALGLSVIVSVNTAHYQLDLAQKKGSAHVKEMLRIGVNGIQLDAVYEPVFRRETSRLTKMN